MPKVTKRKHNPVGTKGFAFIEFASPTVSDFSASLQKLGFLARTTHFNNVRLFQQGNINFLLNTTKNSAADSFMLSHGPSVSSIGLHVESSQLALESALMRGAKQCQHTNTLPYPVIMGIGDVLLYFLDDKDIMSLHPKAEIPPATSGLNTIDHLAINVGHGELKKYQQFFERIFNFTTFSSYGFDQGSVDFQSYAVLSPCGSLLIPLNEPKNATSKIAKYLHQHKGSGVQHIAFISEDIYKSATSLLERGITLENVPQAYYKRLKERLPEHGEPEDLLEKCKILVDGKGRDILLQTYSEKIAGEIFFELIERKGDLGLGEGNFVERLL